MYEQVPLSPISHTIQSQPLSDRPKVSIEEVIQSYSKRLHRYDKKVIQRMTYLEALTQINKEKHKLFNDWLASKVKAKTEDETENAPKDNFLKDMSIEYLRIQLDNFESMLHIKYKRYDELVNMTLGELNTYVQSRMDWYSSKLISNCQRQNIRNILLFICSNNNLAAPCEKFKVGELLNHFHKKRLITYATAVSKNEPISLNNATNIKEACLYGRSLHKLEEAFGKNILKKALTQKIFKDITNKRYTNDLISYYLLVSPTPFFQSEKDFWGYLKLRSEKKPITYYNENSKLTPYIRNYHRFSKTTLDILKANYEDTGRSLPLILIIHSGLDYDGAFVRDQNLDNLVSNREIKSLMIEGKETLDSISSLLPGIAGTYGPINQVMLAGHGRVNSILLAGSFDASATMKKASLTTNSNKSKEFIKKLLEQLKKPSDSVPGPKEARILLNACLTDSNTIPLDELSDVKYFKSFMDKINKHIDALVLGDKTEIVKTALRNKLRNKVQTIGYKTETYSEIEAVLTALDLESDIIIDLKNYIFTLTDEAGQEDEVNKRHTGNQSDIQNYIKAHPNLVAYIRSIIKEEREKANCTIDKDAVQENIVYGANASITKPNLLKDGLLTLNSGRDPYIISPKKDYITNGIEPQGVFNAVLEYWASNEKELMTIISNRVSGDTRSSWDNVIILSLFDCILNIHKDNIFFIYDCKILAERLQSIRLNPKKEMIEKFKDTRTWDEEIRFCFEKLATTTAWKENIPLLVYQHWMQIDNSKIDEFFKELSVLKCNTAFPLVNLKYIEQKIEPVMSGDYNLGKLILSLLAIINGNREAYYRDYLNHLLGERTELPEEWSPLLSGKISKDNLFIALGRKSSTPDLSSPEEPRNYMDRFHIKSVTLKGKIKNASTPIFSAPEGEVEEGVLNKDCRIYIHGETPDRYAIQHKKAKEIITVFVLKDAVETRTAKKEPEVPSQ